MYLCISNNNDDSDTTLRNPRVFQETFEPCVVGSIQNLILYLCISDKDDDIAKNDDDDDSDTPDWIAEYRKKRSLDREMHGKDNEKNSAK